MIKLIVGLGNFSIKYFKTRHNVGSWYIEKLIKHYSLTSLKKEKKFYGYTSKFLLGNIFVRLLIPNTYMNLSGISVFSIVKYYQYACDEILIVHDELDISPGHIKLKFSGGHNGHNGVRDIIHVFGNNNFYRLCIGIGRPDNKTLITDFVLSEPSSSEKKKIDEVLTKAVDFVEIILTKQSF